MSQNKPETPDPKPSDIVGEWKGGSTADQLDQQRQVSDVPPGQSVFDEPAWRPSDQIDKDKIDESAHPEADRETAG